MQIFFAPVSVEHDVQVSAGRSYYFALNMISTTAALVGGGFFTMREPMTATPVQHRVNPFAGSYLSELDAAAGAALIATLKAP